MKKDNIYFLIIFIILILSCSKKEEHLFIIFDNANNLKIGDKIKLNEKIIGEIKELTIVNNQIKIRAKINKDIKIMRNSQFIAVIEDKNKSYIKIIPPAVNGKYLNSGEIVFGVNEINEDFKL
ncbi:MAG TPA: MlaD family protein [bacterium]|nr:MlaD family protein [bacterium]HOL46822.1 MlaD family protein [bacterium]HPQ18652.1 MlaD family protein [bacterium]